MSSFKKRKEQRVLNFAQNVFGWKLRPCTACSGSGHYDSGGGHACGACNGTGKERHKPAQCLEGKDVSASE